MSKKTKNDNVELRVFVFKMKPNSLQEEFFTKTFGCVRKIYNLMLDEQIKQYELKKEGLIDKIPLITPAQFKKEYAYLKEVDSLALANVQQNLLSAFNNFFAGRSGFPQHKTKRKCKCSYTTNNVNGNISLDGEWLTLPKLKSPVKIALHRSMGNYNKIKSCTIKKSPSGEYSVSILVEIQKIALESKPIHEDRIIGLDYSSKSLYVDSQGIECDYPRFYRLMEKKLAKLQKNLSRKLEPYYKEVNEIRQIALTEFLAENPHLSKKDFEKVDFQYPPESNNLIKARLKVAKCHQKIANQRKDFLHKESYKLVQTNDYVVVEDLNLSNIKRCLKLGKSTSDNGFGMFRNFMGYKLERMGGKLVKVDKLFPSTKTCSGCGNKKNMALSERTYICEHCGLVIDRDHNAAINIKREGIRLLLQAS